MKKIPFADDDSRVDLDILLATVPCRLHRVLAVTVCIQCWTVRFGSSLSGAQFGSGTARQNGGIATDALDEH